MDAEAEMSLGLSDSGSTFMRKRRPRKGASFAQGPGARYQSQGLDSNLLASHEENYGGKVGAPLHPWVHSGLQSFGCVPPGVLCFP